MKFILIALLVSGCSLVNQKLDPNIYYRRDIQLEINGEKFDGVAVPKKSDKYEIKIHAAGKIDLLTITSCHREVKIEDAGGTFSPDKTSYTYVPVKGIEDTKGCFLDIGAYEKDQGRHSWATVVIDDGSETIPSEIKCDGFDKQSGGVSACQAKSGLVQEIIFPTEVISKTTKPECGNVMTSKDRKLFEYVAPVGECLYFFVSENGQVHMHVSEGYQSILIRKVGQ